ncbi:hypothetical protein L598_001500000670 [Mesorhizobium sp. J18]|nr:hypothetical protein L598_001500000670 [Mesorhizobium sp. J18]
MPESKLPCLNRICGQRTTLLGNRDLDPRHAPLRSEVEDDGAVGTLPSLVTAPA